MTYLPDAAFKKSVRAATIANITLSAPQTIDGIAVIAGDRVLVKDQSTPATNGIYIVAAGAWTRPADVDSISEIAGSLVNVDSGNTQGGFLYSNDLKTTDTLGTTPMPWYAVVNDSRTQTLSNKAIIFKAGSATAGTAPIKLTSGTLMSTAENGAFEYDGTHLYFTVGTTRYQLDSMSSNIITANSFVASTAVSTPLIISPANSALAITPNAGYGLNVNLSTTGDFAVNTDDLYVDTSTGNVGISDTTPSEKLEVTGNIKANAISGTALTASTQLISTVATGTAPLVVTSTTAVTNLNADLLDGVDGASYFRSGSVVMNTNPFGGRSLYVNTINDAFFRADKRWVVTGNYYNAADDTLVGAVSNSSLSNLFDGDYESTMSIPAGQYAIVNVNFSTESGGLYPGYPYGDFYLSHYNTSYSASATVSTYCNYTPHGIGWHTYTFTDFIRNGTSSLITTAHNSVYSISQAEFKIYAPSSTTASITAIDYKLDRPGSNEMPSVDKYRVNNLYSTLNLKKWAYNYIIFQS